MSVALHDYWRSSASYRLRIALALKGVAFETRAVDLRAGEQREQAHLALNPQGLVPVLEIDGLVLTQSLAILDYLDETRPEPPLLPKDAAGRARARALAQLIAVDIHPICNLRVAKLASAWSGARDAMGEWMRSHIGPGLEALERRLDDGAADRFCHGDAPTIADICLVPQLYNARRFDVAIDGLARILDIERHCQDLEAFRAAAPRERGSVARDFSSPFVARRPRARARARARRARSMRRATRPRTTP